MPAGVGRHLTSNALPTPEVPPDTAALRARFQATAGRLFAVFERLGGQITARPTAREVLSSLVRELNRLEGTAALYGFPEVTDLVTTLEARVDRWLGDPSFEPARRGETVLEFVARLRPLLGYSATPASTATGKQPALKLVEREQGGADGDEMRKAVVAAALSQAWSTPDDVEVASRAGVHLEATMIVVEAKKSRFAELRELVDRLPIQVVNVRSAAKLTAALGRYRPMVVWFDADAGLTPVVNGIALIRLVDPDGITSILVSASATKAAVRRDVYAIGADAFLLNPLDPLEVHANLAARLERRRLQRIATSLHPRTA
ncbi:MAG: hypothetical protein ACT4R6_05820, partial [Gemmatimonadaceae bacterium]